MKIWTVGIVVTLIGAASGTMAAAQSAPPQMQNEQQACEADVYALCGEAIPDVDRITACLRKQWQKVSPQCRAVMANYSRRHNDQSRASRSD